MDEKDEAEDDFLMLSRRKTMPRLSPRLSISAASGYKREEIFTHFQTSFFFFFSKTDRLFIIHSEVQFSQWVLGGEREGKINFVAYLPRALPMYGGFGNIYSETCPPLHQDAIVETERFAFAEKNQI